MELPSDWRADIWETTVSAQEWRQYGESDEERLTVVRRMLGRAAAHSGYVNPVISLIEREYQDCRYSAFTVTAERPITDGPAPGLLPSSKPRSLHT